MFFIPVCEKLYEYSNIIIENNQKIFKSLSINFTSVLGYFGWYKFYSNNVIEDLALVFAGLKDKFATLDNKFEKFY